MKKLSFAMFCLTLLLIAESVQADSIKRDFGNYSISIDYPILTNELNDSISKTENVTIYRTCFYPTYNIGRALLELNQSDEEGCFYLYDAKYSQNSEIAYMMDQIEKNATQKGERFSRVNKPYPGMTLSLPLNNGLSKNLYFGLIDNKTLVVLETNSSTDRFQKTLLTLKVIRIEKEATIETSKIEWPSMEGNLPFSGNFMNLWQEIPILVSIISVIVTIYIYLRSRKIKSLAYDIIAEIPLLTLSKDLPEKIKILYEDKLIKDVWLLIYRITNNGNLPITFDDFKQPISIAFDKDIIVLDAKIASSSPENINANLDLQDNKIQIKPELMNSRDSIKTNIFLTNYISGIKPVPNARIIGINQIDYYYENSKYKNKNTIVKLIYLTFCAILLLYPLAGLITVIFIIAIIYKFNRNLLNRSVLNILDSIKKYLGMH